MAKAKAFLSIAFSRKLENKPVSQYTTGGHAGRIFRKREAETVETIEHHGECPKKILLLRQGNFKAY